MLSAQEQKFIEQSELFRESVLSEMGLDSLDKLPDITTRTPVPVTPTLIEDYQQLSIDEIDQLVDSYYSEAGVAYFIVLNHHKEPASSHPLFDLAAQLEEPLNLRYPLEHPLEGHPEAIKRFGKPDGTLKVYNLETRDSSKRYREQGETSEKFDMHNDGLGSGGTVQTAVLYTDSPPLYGGYTYFCVPPIIALNLAKTDYEGYRSLFLPDAITMIRPRGKGALKVTSPILYLGEGKTPKTMFRMPSGEYQIVIRDNYPPLLRAWNFLQDFSRPFAPGSFFVHFSQRGHGCFIRNHWVAHGRTAFFESDDLQLRRVLARKWFMESIRDKQYKHVPGVFLDKEFASLYPEYFGTDLLEGEWLYDSEKDTNYRIK